jgi:hypothetical protein
MRAIITDVKDGLAGCLMWVASVVAILISATAIFVASAYLIGRTGDMTRLLNELRITVDQLVVQQTTAQQIATTSPLQTYMDRIENLSRAGTESGVMQFLFQVVTAAFLSIGVWLISEARSRVKKVKSLYKKADARMVAIGPFVTGNLKTNCMISEVILASHSGWLITQSNSSIDTQPCSDMRARLMKIDLLLDDVRVANCGMSSDQCDFMIDLLATAQISIGQGQRVYGVTNLTDLMSLCEKCINLLRNNRTKLIELYTKRERILSDA